MDAALPLNALAGLPSTDVKTPSKNDSNDRITKPVSAKSDPAVGVLVRFSRASGDISRGGSAGNANDTPQVDPSRFVGRVAKAFQTAQDRGGTLQIRLSPPELGSLHLSLTVKDGAVSAALQADNDNTRRLLLDHLPALRDRLAEHNMRIDRFDVDVRREDAGPQADTRGSQQQQFQDRQQASAPRRHAPAPQRQAEIAPAESLPIAPVIGDVGLNLIV